MMKIQNNSKGFGAVEALLIVLVLVLLGGAGWYVWSSNKESNKDEGSPNSQNTKPELPKENPSTDKLSSYNSDVQGLQFDYQKEWKLEDRSNETPSTLTITSPDFSSVVTKGGLIYIAEGGLISITVDKTSSKQFDVREGSYYFNCEFGDNCMLEYFSFSKSTKVDGVDALSGTCGHNDPGTCTYVMRKGKVYGFDYYQPNRNTVADTKTEKDKYLDEYKRFLDSVHFTD